MTVELKLFGTYREGRFKRKTLELAESTLLSEIMKPLNLPADQEKIIMVNGIYTGDDRTLQDNDVVAIFPMIAGG